MKFLRENTGSLLTILFLIVVGILLLANPVTFGMVIVKIAGILLALLGLVDIVRYLRTKPEEAAKGHRFYSGAVSITAGCFCFFATEWFIQVFPVLAVLYGLLQVMLGFRKLQDTMDALRLKESDWYFQAISSAVFLLCGFVTVLNPGMTAVSIWVFTGVAMIVEGALGVMSLVMKKHKP